MPCSHVFRFQILHVLVTDVVYARLQFPSNLIFLPVFLSLHSWEKKVKKDVDKERNPEPSLLSVDFTEQEGEQRDSEKER